MRIRRRMTNLTRKRFIIRRIGVTVTANGPVVRNPEVGMVEYRPQPGGGHVGRVAAYACCRIIRRDVIGNGGAIILRVREVRLVAAVAIRGRVTGGVVAAQVAVGTRIDHRSNRARNRRARRYHVRTLQGKARRAVIKLSIRPEHRVMAGRAE